MKFLKSMNDKEKELKRQVYILYLAYKKKETPLIAKVFVGIIVAYALSPIDLIHDFIPILGYLDDLVLIPMGISFALKLNSPDIMETCKSEAEKKLMKDLTEAKIAGLIIVPLWIAIFIKLAVFISKKFL